jgi:hypothetical protein
MSEEGTQVQIGDTRLLIRVSHHMRCAVIQWGDDRMFSVAEAEELATALLKAATVAREMEAKFLDRSPLTTSAPSAPSLTPEDLASAYDKVAGQGGKGASDGWRPRYYDESWMERDTQVGPAESAGVEVRGDGLMEVSGRLQFVDADAALRVGDVIIAGLQEAYESREKNRQAPIAPAAEPEPDSLV